MPFYTNVEYYHDLELIDRKEYNNIDFIFIFNNGQLTFDIKYDILPHIKYIYNFTFKDKIGICNNIYDIRSFIHNKFLDKFLGEICTSYNIEKKEK